MLNTTRSSNEVPNFVVIDNEYAIVKNLYKGNTYNLYMAIQTGLNQEKFVLIKMRRTNTSDANHELYFLNKLKDLHCIIKILAVGEQRIQDQLYHYQVMERHGPSLKLVYNYLSKNIPISLLCLIAIQTLNSLEQIHKHFIINRNVRPKKLLVSQCGTEILLTDFKYACRYRKQQNGILVCENYKNTANKQFLNKFSSLNSHLDQMPSPRDDLESLALILLYFSGYGSMLKIKEENKSLKHKKLEQIKLALLPEMNFKGAPLEFIQFYNGVKQTSVSDFPQDYEKYKSLFRKLLSNYGFTEKDIIYPHLHKFDVILEEQETRDTIDECEMISTKIQSLGAKRFHRLISLEKQQTKE